MSIAYILSKDTVLIEVQILTKLLNRKLKNTEVLDRLAIK